MARWQSSSAYWLFQLVTTKWVWPLTTPWATRPWLCPSCLRCRCCHLVLGWRTVLSTTPSWATRPTSRRPLLLAPMSNLTGTWATRQNMSTQVGRLSLARWHSQSAVKFMIDLSSSCCASGKVGCPGLPLMFAWCCSYQIFIHHFPVHAWMLPVHVALDLPCLSYPPPFPYDLLTIFFRCTT